MKQRIAFLLILVIPCLPIFAQHSPNRDSLQIFCEGPIFTLCEKMPRLKKGTSAFEDSLMQYLRSINQFPKPGKISMSLAILRSGEVKYVTVKETTIEETELIVGAIKNLNNQWSPGIQNGYIVCCYRPIELEFFNDKVKITITGRL